MKIDTLAHVKNQLSAVIESLGKEPLFITRNGRVTAVLQAVTDEEAEDYLSRNSPGFWRLIGSRRAQALSGQVVPFDPSSYGEKAAPMRAVREARGSYGRKAGRCSGASPEKKRNR